MLKSFRLVSTFCIVLSIMLGFGVTAAQDDEKIEPIPGKWLSQETAFESESDFYSGMEGVLSLDFTVSADKTKIIGVVSLVFADNEFSREIEIPGDNPLLATLSGQFVSSDEAAGIITIHTSQWDNTDEIFEVFEWMATPIEP
jgi:hypothetical protein